jgi:hypothetical protein
MKLTFATFILKKVLFSCERIWMSSGGGPDPLDPPLIYATGPWDIRETKSTPFAVWRMCCTCKYSPDVDVGTSRQAKSVTL